MRGPRMRNRWVWIGSVVSLLLPIMAEAQSDRPLIEIGGLLRTGFRAEPNDSALFNKPTGFDIFDARLSVEGKIGIIFDYFTQVEYDPGTESFKLLDAIAAIPVTREVKLSFGLFRPAFGLEALKDKGDLPFLERAQATQAIGPGRQVGVAASVEAADGRLFFGTGLFNGNGQRFGNDGDNYMFSARGQFNSIGAISFYDDFVIQVGGSIAYSSDSSAELGLGIVTGGPRTAREFTTAFSGNRLLWGTDLKASYRDFSITGEYLRAKYNVDSGLGSTISEKADAYGGYVEMGYRAHGAVEGVVRYDSFEPAIGDRRDFLLFGFNIYPAFYTKFGLQYGVAVNSSQNAPTIADGQFLFIVQVDF